MFKGSIVALVTPLNNDGSIDDKSLKNLVDYHVASNTSAIVAVGTSGESATLNPNEHIDTVKKVVDYADGRIDVIAGTGANSTVEAVHLTQKVESLSVKGCLSVTPYYNRPTQEGLYLHYKTIANNTCLPQILYNVPGRTGCDLKIETVARLAEINNIVSLKDATGDLSRVRATKKLVRDDFTLLSGDDLTSFEFLMLGGDGMISVTANIAAKQLTDVYHLIKDGKIEDADQINDKLMSLHKNLFVESNPIPVKWACKKIGLIQSSIMRLPLTELSEESIPKIEFSLKQANLL